MAFIDTIAASEARGDVLAMYARQQAAYGYVPNYAGVFSHRPEVMERWGRLLAAIKRPMSPRRFELVTVAASLALRNSYCALAHGGKLAGILDADTVRAIAEGAADGVLSEEELAIVSFARKVATDASQVAAEDVDALKAHGLGDDEIFDIVAAAAARAFFTKVLDGLGVEPDACFREMNPVLAGSLVVGRAVAEQASDCLPGGETESPDPVPGLRAAAC